MSSDEHTRELAPDVLIVGCGYCGHALGRRLVARGARVWGSTRDDVAGLQSVGVTPLRWELAARQWPVPEALREGLVDVVYMVPPLPGADPNGAMAAALEALEARLRVRSLVYVGATSVYGDMLGASVSAQTPRRPLGERGRQRAEAEDLALELGTGFGWRVTLARLPGIYGPGRNLLEKLRAGQYKLVDGGRKWTARIHRDDVAMGVEALLRHGVHGEGYVLCDDEPFQVRDLIDYLVGRLKLPWPEEVTLEEYERQHGAFAASFWRTSNRYDNRHIKALPGFALAYPSFREGYEALLAREGGTHGL
jgi:nucleoside-diphosphate-sugar epimerase